jgi:hypothetical protein
MILFLFTYRSRGGVYLKMMLTKKWPVLSLMLAVVIAIMSLNTHSVMAETWSFKDGDGENGLNVDVTKAASNPKLVDFKGVLFAIWSESIGSTDQIRVKKYDSSTDAWVTADSNTPLNKNAEKDAKNPSLVVFNNELYAAWQEVSTSNWQLRIKKFNGSGWVSVDGDGTDGLNVNTRFNALSPKLIVYNNALYVIWEETSGANQIRVKKYGGSGSSWSSADGGVSLNKSVSQGALSVSVVVWGNKLYATWSESNGTASQIRVKSYDGSSWTFVDGNDTTGMNVNNAKYGSAPALEVYDNKLYLAWAESASKNQIRVKVYNGTSWTEADGGLADTGINQNPLHDAYLVRLITFDGKLYATWHEAQLFDFRVRVKVYDGTTWVSADGNTLRGLNRSETNMATFGHLAVLTNNSESTLYAAFLESNGVNQVRVVSLGPSNQAPVASDVEFTGTLKAGHTLTGDYTYTDEEGDAEGATAFKWYTADDAAGLNKQAIDGAVSATLALTATEANKYIIFEVTPAASAGTAKGRAVSYTSATAVVANAAPAASDVSSSGTLKVGHTLTGVYNYSDEEGDAEGATSFKWYTADDAAGLNKQAIDGAVSATLALTAAEANKYIVFEVTPAASTGTTTGTAVSYTSATAVLANAAPAASEVIMTGKYLLNQTLSGSYSYADTEQDAEAVSLFKWYMADDAAGLNKTVIAGETGRTLELKAAQYNKYISFEVTPVAATGTLAGTTVRSIFVGPIGALKGDANGDGTVTPADALLVNKYVQGKIQLTDEQLVALDMDNDGDVDAEDAKIILDVYNGKVA